MDLRFFTRLAWKAACRLVPVMCALALAGAGCRSAPGEAWTSAPAATATLAAAPRTPPAQAETATAPVPSAPAPGEPSPGPTLTPPRRPGPPRIMPLGDSLTGVGVGGPAHSYRGYLEALLREAGCDFDFVGTQSEAAYGGSDPDHEGHGSYTIGPDDIVGQDGTLINLYAHLEEYLQTEPDVILLLIGINDMYAGGIRPGAPERAAGKLGRLVARIQALRPGVTIFVASLAPAARYDVATWPEFHALNQAARALGEADPDDAVYFVDLYGRLAPGWEAEVDLVDGIHFSERGARKVAEAWFEVLVDKGCSVCYNAIDCNK